ncbi:MAG: HD domain-containing protein [Oscillospiraceae bacterium]|nr:HD domain-containing protein [Oscillospiraceae bacterium]
MKIDIPLIPAALIRRLNEHGYEAYVVGGCVRDAMLGNEPHDWDICTSAKPMEVIECFPDKNVAKTGLQHGTVMVIDGGEGYEITTFRTDGDYSDHRHPDKVTFVSNLREDLARRDFTINAMAYHPESGLMDFFSGQEDLKAGMIRCVGDAKQRFEEDGLRILRALRFAARFGFCIEEKTANAMHECKELLEHIAAERIFTELKGFIVGKGVGPLLREYRDIMAQILPPLEKMFDFQQHNPHHCHDVWEHTVCAVENVEPELVLRLTMLFHDCGKPDSFSTDERGVGHFYHHGERSVELTRQMLSDLRCDNLLRDRILLQVEHHDLPLPQTPREGRRFLKRMGEEGAFWSLSVHRADYMGQAPGKRPEKLARYETAKAVLTKLLEEEACFTLKNLAVKGRDLMEIGYTAGKELGKALDRLLEAVMDGVCPNEKEALLRLAKEQLNS